MLFFKLLTNIHTYSHFDGCIRENLGLVVLPKDIWHADRQGLNHQPSGQKMTCSTTCATATQHMVTKQADCVIYSFQHHQIGTSNQFIRDVRGL